MKRLKSMANLAAVLPILTELIKEFGDGYLVIEHQDKLYQVGLMEAVKEMLTDAEDGTKATAIVIQTGEQIHILQ